MIKHPFLLLLLILGSVCTHSQSYPCKDTVAFESCNILSVRYTGNADSTFKAVVNVFI